MQLNSNTLSQQMDQISKQMRQAYTINDSEAKIILEKLKVLLDNKNPVDQVSLNEFLIIMLKVQQKTYNVSSKVIADIWKIILIIQLKSLDQNNREQEKFQNINEICLNLQQIYRKVLDKDFHEKLVSSQHLLDAQILFRIWKKSFLFSDLRNLQNAFLSLYIGWNMFFNISNQKNSNIGPQSFGFVEKSCMFLMKYSQKVKQSQTFESLICLLKNIQQRFYKDFQKQIRNGIKQLRLTFKLTQTLNYTNLHLNTWQKIVLARVVCISKRLNKIQEIDEVIHILQMLKQTYFFEKLINFSRKQRSIKNKAILIISAQRLSYILFQTMVNLWVNSHILNQTISSNEDSKNGSLEISKNISLLDSISLQLIRILIKSQITVLMIRSLIKKLKITNLTYAVKQWKYVFSIMSLLLKQYPQNRTIIQFQDDSSYISNRFSPAIKFPITIFLKLKGQSIPFKQENILLQLSDTNRKQKIWITMRNYHKNVMIFSIIKFVNNVIWEKQQRQFSWNQYQANTIQITIKINKIKMVLNGDQSIVLSIQNTLKKIDYMILCDNKSGMGSTISQLFNFKIIQYNIFEEVQKQQVDFVDFIDQKYYTLSKDPIKQNLKFSKCQRTLQDSFVHLVQSLGDLQLFMLVLSHTLKKIKNQSQLLQMIRSVLNLMQQFTIHKGVQRKELTSQQKQIRRNSVLCLCWFFAKQTKSVFIVLQLMRFLYIRGKRDNQELLKFLTNFTYWRQFKLQSQILLVMKIKQILKESAKQEEKISYLVFCRKILFDMLIFFKQSHYLMAEKQNCLKLHRLILETVHQHIKDILELTNRKNKYFMVQIFQFLQFLINIVSCIINRKIHEDGLDITFAIQFTLFLRDISKLIFVSKQTNKISKSDIDNALQRYYRKEQKQLMVPLSLNIQEAFEQRFSLYLAKIISQSKSLMTLFQTQTSYYEDTQIKIYPINSQTPIFCTESKFYSNVVSFTIYLSMLSEITWNYILFGMPCSQYTQILCQDIWRVSFYQLFKQKRYLRKVCKMLQQTPLPLNQYYLMKILQVVLSYSIFQKGHLYRIVKSKNSLKGICPFKTQHLLLKLLNKLQPSIIDTFDQTECSVENSLQLLSSQESEEQKIYYILFHSQNSDYQSSKQIMQSLSYRKMYGHYRVVVYHVLLRYLVRMTSHKSDHQKDKPDHAQSTLLTSQADPYLRETCPSSRIIVNTQRLQVSLSTKGQVNANLTPVSQLIPSGIEALNFYKSSLTYQHVKEFFKVESKQDIEALKQNFILNVQGMVRGLDAFKQAGESPQLEKYSGFVDVHLRKFSQYLIFKRFPGFRPPNQGQMFEENNTKSRNKFLYKTVHVDLIRHSTQFFVELLKQRKESLNNLSQIWSQVQRKNRYFWNLFITSEKYYSLSDITTELGQRLLLTITNDKPKIQLPKMMSRHSVVHSVSLLSERNDVYEQSESTTLFQDNDFYMAQLQETQEREKQRVRKGSTSHTKQVRIRKFKVLLIDNDFIYQGFLFITQKDLIVFQETYTTQKLYDNICANPNERRDDDQIQKQPKCLQILVGQKSTFFLRKYLYFDAALEVCSHEKQYFFCFDTAHKRNKFCSLYLKQHRLITYQTSKRQIKQESLKWVKGLLSNYQYLMKINKYANRSPNDLSQYYVMPWTVVEFQQRQINRAYLFQHENFRDLKKPLGRIFQKKWKQIQQRFKSSFMNSKSQVQGGFGIEPFLYGSFYSNPAIVTNYMIRMQPFSTLHYHLQSEKIDVADRLFFQFQDQYRSIRTNLGDVKQLTPEFYSNPEFLKNRAKLNLGSRQNKQIVNDVRLPKWADTASEFVFKMKYFLQSPLISKYLNYWIDLIFGVKAKRQNALSAENLFVSQIYGPKQPVSDRKKQEQMRNSKKALQQSKNSSIIDLESRIILNKEFGQLPLTLFQSQHPQFQSFDDYYTFKGTIEKLHTISELSNERQVQLSINQNFALVFSENTFQMYETSSQDHTKNQNWKAVCAFLSTCQLVSPKIVSGQKLNSLSPYLFYVKKQTRKLYCRFIKKAMIFNTVEIKEQHYILNAQVFNWMNDQFIKDIQFLKMLNQALGREIGLTEDLVVQICNLGEIVPCFYAAWGTNEDLKLIVSLDQMNKIFLLKYFPDKIQVINNFQIRSCYFEEKVTKLLVHKMSLIVCLTSYNRLLTYNFYGDLVGSKEIGFKLQARGIVQSARGKVEQAKGKVEQASCIVFFNKQTSELLIGTNLGNIWKVDLFQFYKTQDQIHPKQLWFQKICINTKQHQYDIKALEVKRYGRHWQIYTVSHDQTGSKVMSKVRCLTLKNITFNLYK